MNSETQKKIFKYLENSWAPVDLLTKKFGISRSELSHCFAEMLAFADVRIDRDIVTVETF